MAFTVHEFIHVGTQHLLVNSFHAFELCFYPVPVAFDTLGMHSGDRVNEIHGVVH